MSRELLARAWAAGAGPGDGPLTIDLDSTICETHGLAAAGIPLPAGPPATERPAGALVGDPRQDHPGRMAQAGLRPGRRRPHRLRDRPRRRGGRRRDMRQRLHVLHHPPTGGVPGNPFPETACQRGLAPGTARPPPASTGMTPQRHDHPATTTATPIPPQTPPKSIPNVPRRRQDTPDRPSRPQSRPGDHPGPKNPVKPNWALSRPGPRPE